MKKKHNNFKLLEVNNSHIINLLSTNFSELMSGFY
jgi:hypothetical protein